MSWMAKLYETYEQGMQLDLSSDEQLMPIGHTLQNAHINVVIDISGQFLRAKPGKTPIMLPATESSASRGSGEAPHPLADKLQYTAGDYARFGGVKKHYFEGYRETLRKWCESEHGHPHIQAVLSYIEKGSLVEDLIAADICQVDENNRLLTRWMDENTEAPALLKLLPKEKGLLDQGNALVCWSVHEINSEAFDTWKNAEIQQRWIAYDTENANTQSLCLISGEVLPLARNHPAKLRHTGDKAKLISANDTSGFTYRGRFLKADNAANVSFEVTQKAHNALRWLIGTRQQAYRNGDQVIVSWAISGKDTPSPILDMATLLSEPLTLSTENSTSLETEVNPNTNLGQQFAISFKRYIAGYYQDFEDTPMESIVVMGLDSATPGRMAITYYRDFGAKEFLDKISEWHQAFAWPQRVVKETRTAKGKKTNSTFWIPGAPSPWTIINACYGDVIKSNDALKRQVIERLLPCIVESRQLPRDLLQLAQHRACNPNSGEHWEWERNLGVACALFRGFHLRHPDNNLRRNHPMSLDTDNTSRDYLYGRLLALAERLEEVSLFASGAKRPTTANRLMQRFTDRPYDTWLTIYKQLGPYMRHLKSSRPEFLNKINSLMDEVMDKFEREDYIQPDKLSGEFLLGFHCQRLALKPESKNNQPTQTTEA